MAVGLPNYFPYMFSENNMDWMFKKHKIMVSIAGRNLGTRTWRMLVGNSHTQQLWLRKQTKNFRQGNRYLWISSGTHNNKQQYKKFRNYITEDLSCIGKFCIRTLSSVLKCENLWQTLSDLWMLWWTAGWCMLQYPSSMSLLYPH